MAVSRRRFLTGIAATGAATAIAQPQEATAAPVLQQAGQPDAAAIAMQRMAFGPRPGDIARVRAMGVDAYIQEQLNAPAGDDATCQQYLDGVRIKIRYDPDGAQGPQPEVNEARPITGPNGTLGKTTQELWSLQTTPNLNFSERTRPWTDVRVAAFVRAVHSRYQLREVMADFWHNHFNARPASDTAIAVAFPEYDRIIRSNWNGNFRQFVEAIGKSTAMLYDLDNLYNKAGGGEAGNENYARELFELHTLGSDNYLKFLGNETPVVPTITYGTETFPAGYLDDDVYEAVRCFTGWTVANGHWERSALNDGTFYYDDSWHDDAQKVVLGRSIPRSQPALKDGRDVYDLLCRHPGTARHLCTKLCRRLIGDDPPPAVVDAAVKKWMDTRDAPDQIKQVLNLILSSNEFKTTWGQKCKRPFEFLVAYLRATEATLPVDVTNVGGDAGQGGYWGSLMWQFNASGHRIFEWPTPTGHPDRMSYWANTNGLLRMWNLTWAITQSWGGKVAIDIPGKTNLSQTCTQIVDGWIERLFGRAISATTRERVIAFLATGGSPTQPPAPLKGEWNEQKPEERVNALNERLIATVQLLAMSPDFLQR